MWFPFPPQEIYREKGLKSLQSSTDDTFRSSGLLPVSLVLHTKFACSQPQVMPTPLHALHIHLVELHHWPAFQQPAPHQCQKVYLVCRTTKPNTLLYTAWNSAAVFTSLPKNHRNIYHCLVTLYLSHTSTGILERTVLQTSVHLKYLWGIQHVVAALNWFLTRKDNTFFNHPVEMFSLWANFRNIHRPILRLVFLRAKDCKVATCLNKRSLSTSSRVQCKLLSKEQFESRAVKALTVI